MNGRSLERRMNAARSRRAELVEAGVQTCARCRQVKALDQYREQVQPFTGFRSIDTTCKACRIEQVKARRAR